MEAKSTKWTLDSAYDDNMSYRKDLMNDHKVDKSLEVSVANNAVEIGSGMGNVCVNLPEGVKIIQDVAHVPNLSANLLSVSKIVEKDIVVVFMNEGGLIYHKDDCEIKGNVRATASHINGMFQLDECKKEKL